MNNNDDLPTRTASAADAMPVAQLLYDFNREYNEPTPSPDVLAERVAEFMDLGTSEDDVVACKLYESLGFSNHESRPDGPIMYVFEKEL
jgi:hypothetical protein